MTSALPTDYLLHLADNALVLGQRNAEWCGHGPALEEDIALSNNSLDLIGQARLLYQAAAAQIGGGASEDSLAWPSSGAAATSSMSGANVMSVIVCRKNRLFAQGFCQRLRLVLTGLAGAEVI